MVDIGKQKDCIELMQALLWSEEWPKLQNWEDFKDNFKAPEF